MTDSDSHLNWQEMQFFGGMDCYSPLRPRDAPRQPCTHVVMGSTWKVSIPSFGFMYVHHPADESASRFPPYTHFH